MPVFWPVWQWYVTTLRDPAEDATVLAALGTAGIFLLWKKSARKWTQRLSKKYQAIGTIAAIGSIAADCPAHKVANGPFAVRVRAKFLKRYILQTSSQIPLYIPILLLLLYIVSFHLFSPLLRAVIAMFTLGYVVNSWRFGPNMQLWLYGLLLLSLPVLSPMYLYLGYPLRLLVGKLSVLLLRVFGSPVMLVEGIAFNWAGKYIWSDDLCSGVRKLWAGLYLTCSLAAFYDLKVRKTLVATGWAVLAFVLANTVRTAFLVYVYGGMTTISWWMHKWEGPFMFLLAALAIVWLVQRLKKHEHVSENTEGLNDSYLVSWRTIIIFLLLCLIAAVVPLLQVESGQIDFSANFPGWPEQFNGIPLQQITLSVTLSEREDAFIEDFSGPIACFTDGEQEIIIRWIARPSNILSAWDCFHRTDYTLSFGPIWRDQDGYPWRTFEASTPDETLQVLEHIYDDTGQSWTDISSWYWAALLRKTTGPWWIVTIIREL